MNRPIRLLMLAGIALAACACNLRNSAAGKDAVPKEGVIHTSVACKADSTATYALYLPENHDSATEKTPLKGSAVIIYFDPHADGLLPLTLYKDLADRYGMILLGSNKTKNGMSPGEIDRIVSILFHEAVSVLPSDSTAIYLAGFSGGARIATLNAFYRVPARGVISCGAGLTGASNAPVNKAEYYGIAGLADFNMNELVQLDFPLGQAGIRHAIRTFNGGHAWPPVEVMEDAIRWFMLNAQRDGRRSPGPDFMAGVYDGYRSAIDRSIARGDLLSAEAMAREAFSALDGLTDAGAFRSFADSMAKLQEYKLRAERRKQVMEDEELERRMLIQAIVDKDTTWWRKRNQQYLAVVNREHPATDWRYREDSLRTRRIMAFLGVLCYMNATSVLTSQNAQAAATIVSIYELCDPGNPEPNYMRAILLAREENDKGTVAELSRAIDKGFSDGLRMSEQPEFAGLKESPSFFDLQKRIK